LAFADLSGAQSVAVGLAVRLALGELGSVAHGVRYETIILDEADSWLVGEKQDAYLRLLRTLADQGLDVLCISHIPNVKDQEDQQIELLATAAGTEVCTA
jgi:DNA repair exonuclease SbcCD ATPase subunit